MRFEMLSQTLVARHVNCLACLCCCRSGRVIVLLLPPLQLAQPASDGRQVLFHVVEVTLQNQISYPLMTDLHRWVA